MRARRGRLTPADLWTGPSARGAEQSESKHEQKLMNYLNMCISLSYGGELSVLRGWSEDPSLKMPPLVLRLFWVLGRGLSSEVVKLWRKVGIKKEIRSFDVVSALLLFFFFKLRTNHGWRRLHSIHQIFTHAVKKDINFHLNYTFPVLGLGGSLPNNVLKRNIINTTMWHHGKIAERFVFLCESCQT